MHDFHIRFREGEDAQAEGSGHHYVTALRVEGWSQDYAFFSERDKPTVPTLLVPRDRVQFVERGAFHPELSEPATNAD